MKLIFFLCIFKKIKKSNELQINGKYEQGEKNLMTNDMGLNGKANYCV